MVRRRFKLNTLERIPNYCYSKYVDQMSNKHFRPILIPNEYILKFKERYQRDLGEEYQTNSFGLSMNACMCPQCPFFKVKMGEGNRETESPAMALTQHTFDSLPVMNWFAQVDILRRIVGLDTNTEAAAVELCRKFYHDLPTPDYDEFEALFATDI